MKYLDSALFSLKMNPLLDYCLNCFLSVRIWMYKMCRRVSGVSAYAGGWEILRGDRKTRQLTREAQIPAELEITAAAAAGDICTITSRYAGGAEPVILRFQPGETLVGRVVSY